VSLLAITSNGKIGLGLVALLFIAFALVSSFVLPRRNPDFPGRRLGAYLAVAVLLFVAMLAAVVVFAKEGEEEEGHEAQVTETAPGQTTATTETGTETETGTGGASGDAAAGEAVFGSAGCGDCHALEAAGSSGNIGPNLDESKPDAALVEERVRNGSGPMPAFEGRLSDTEIADVTAYVVASTSG
jgi:mono/diheme cytochrome c family protein